MFDFFKLCDILYLGDDMRRFLSEFRLNTTLYIYISIVYMELLLKAFTCETFFDIGLLVMPVFSIVPALIMGCCCSRLKPKTAKIVTVSVMTLLFLLYTAQLVYFRFFGSYFIFYSLAAGGAGQITGEGMLGSTLKAIASSIPAMLLLVAPLVIYIVFGKKNIKYRRTKWRSIALGAGAMACVHICTVLFISVSGSLSSLQNGEFDTNLTVGKFGLLRSEVLDFKYNILGVDQKVDFGDEDDFVIDTVTPPITSPDDGSEPIDTSPNVMDIDFEALNAENPKSAIKNLNNYFASKEPTLKNEYTGMYKGYNLITITAEGFSPYAVDPELTPTLYKMSQEGFKFTNFYTPIWGVSTSDGEYTACTGLLPKSGVWSFYRSGNNSMPFTLGNMFQSIGVTKTFAYHNHTHDYYRRDVSHPNMGYKYIGMGTGMEEYVQNRWPESDLEMITGSTKDYLSDDQPFHAYYMTVSGHLNYTFVGNMMAYKNRDKVAHLDCSDDLKAYYA